VAAAVGIFLLVCAILWYFSRRVKLLAELRDETERLDEEAESSLPEAP
jgi:hypothetical protein